MEEIPPPPRIGAKLYNHHGILHHVRAIVDQEDDWYYVVMRRWSTRKQRWEYSIECPYAFQPWKSLNGRAMFDPKQIK